MAATSLNFPRSIENLLRVACIGLPLPRDDERQLLRPRPLASFIKRESYYRRDHTVWMPEEGSLLAPELAANRRSVMSTHEYDSDDEEDFEMEGIEKERREQLAAIKIQCLARRHEARQRVAARLVEAAEAKPLDVEAEYEPDFEETVDMLSKQLEEANEKDEAIKAAHRATVERYDATLERYERQHKEYEALLARKNAELASSESMHKSTGAGAGPIDERPQRAPRAPLGMIRIDGNVGCTFRDINLQVGSRPVLACKKHQAQRSKCAQTKPNDQEHALKCTPCSDGEEWAEKLAARLAEKPRKTRKQRQGSEVK